MHAGLFLQAAPYKVWGRKIASPAPNTAKARIIIAITRDETDVLSNG
jgi:hypothetical protein